MKNLKGWAIAVVAGVVVPGIIWAATTQFNGTSSGATTVNCLVAGACPITINQIQANLPQDALAGGAPVAEKQFGSSLVGAPLDNATTTWTTGQFTNDLAVGASMSVAGTSTFNGELNGANKTLAISMKNSTTTCSSLNNSGFDRIVKQVDVILASSTYTGSAALGLIAGTSTILYATPTTPIISTTLEQVNGTSVLTTTSTLGTATGSDVGLSSALWRNGEYWVVKSGTSTNSGICHVTYGSTF